MAEEWRRHPEYPTYLISSHGQVKGPSGQILKPYLTGPDGGTKYLTIKISNSNKKVHRLVARAFLEPVEGKLLVDHIDRNPKNNRADNLRWCSKSENEMNTVVRSDNTIGFKGVYKHKQSGLFHARIHVNKRKLSLGYFKTPEEAYAAYCRAAQEHYGAFACTG